MCLFVFLCSNISFRDDANNTLLIKTKHPHEPKETESQQKYDDYALVEKELEEFDRKHFGRSNGGDYNELESELEEVTVVIEEPIIQGAQCGF